MLQSEYAENTVQALLDAPLLLHCGETGDYPAFGLHQWVDKAQAEQSGLSQEWEHYSQARSHDLTSHLLRRARSQSDANWNQYTRQFREAWDEILRPKVAYGFARSKLHHELEAAVHWDMLNIVMLDSFIAFRPPLFFNRLKEVYLAGHFPCGIKDSEMTQTDLITLTVY